MRCNDPGKTAGDSRQGFRAPAPVEVSLQARFLPETGACSAPGVKVLTMPKPLLSLTPCRRSLIAVA